MSAVLEFVVASTRIVPLSDAVEINPKPDRGMLSDDLDVSFVPMAMVEAGTGNIDATTERKYAEVKKGYTYFRDGDVLFAKITPCMENGKMAVARHLRNGIGFGSTEFHVLRSREGVDPYYVYHFVASSRFRAEAAHYMTGAVGQKRVPTSFLERAEIPLPPIEDQRRIAAEIEKQFSRLDEAVANLKRVKANLKRYKAAVLKAAVEGRLVPTEAELARREGRSYETGAQLLQRILETRRSRWKGKGKEPAAPDMIDLPDLPTGWRWVSIEEIADRVADVDHKMPKPADSDIRYISTRDFIDEDGIDFKGAKCISQADYEVLCKKVRPEFGDILLSRYGTVGEVRVVNTERPFQASYSIAIIKSLTGFELAPYLTIALRSRVMQDQIKRDVRATAQPDLGLAHIRLLAVPLPPLAEQHRIVAEVDRHLSILYGVEAEVDANLKRAERLRQSVLGRVFAG